MLKQAIDFCCAARGHALAVWLRLAPLSAKRAPPPAQQYKNLTEHITVIMHLFHTFIHNANLTKI